MGRAGMVEAGGSTPPRPAKRRRMFCWDHLVMTESRLEEVVDAYKRFDAFVFDVETLGLDPDNEEDKSQLNPRVNDVFWLGLAGPARTDVIPMGHIRGNLLVPTHKEEIIETEKEREVRLSLPKDDPARQKKKRYKHFDDVWSDAPPQLSQKVVFEALEPLFFGPARKIGHNVKFDLASIHKYYGRFPAPPYGDTMIVQHLLDENLAEPTRRGVRPIGYGLKALVKRWFGFEYEALGKKGAENYSFEEAARYSFYDARWDWLLWGLLVPKMEREEVTKVFDLEMEILEVLLEMEFEGALIDADRLQHLETEMFGRLQSLSRKIQKKHGRPFNINSHQQLAQVIYTERGHAPKRFTRTGAPSTDAKALGPIAVKDPVVKLLAEYTEVNTIYKTFVKGILQRIEDDGRLHTSFRQVGTKTGRFCVSPETLIEMPRDLSRHPDGVPLKEIQPGDWVYSFDWEKRLCLKRVKWVGPTKVSETVKVEIKDEKTGKETTLVCSPDHLIRTYRGDWRAAGMLRVGDALMSMVRRKFEDGYAYFAPSVKRAVFSPSSTTGGKVREHRWIYAQTIGRKVLPSKWDVHHKDEVRINNYPSNLELIDHPAHVKMHKRKTTPEEVQEMLDGGVLRLHPRTLKRLAREYGLQPTNHVVLSVDRGPVQQLWDLEVEDTHTFIGADVALHNSSKDPNVQNMPRKTRKEGREIRSLFIAPPGQLLVAGDYSQIELRVLAHYSRETALIDAFKRGEDIHAVTASKLFGVPVDEVTPEQRDDGKLGNFAAIYGAGPARILEQSPRLKTERAAKAYLAEYWAQFPKVDAWTKRTVAEAQARLVWRDQRKGELESPAFVRTILGRKRRLTDLNKITRASDYGSWGYAARQAVNTRIQGSSADIMKMAMVRLFRAIDETDWKMWLTVHDEIVMAVPKQETDDAVECMRKAMEGVPVKLLVPLVADIGVGKRWSEAKH